MECIRGAAGAMSFSPREFRDTLGAFPTGVCLVSACDAKGDAHAITINSFASVSLEPPLILWSLQRDAEVYELFEGAKRFSISVLSRSQEELSVYYSQHQSHWMRDGDFVLGESGAPIVCNALAVFECALEATYDGGDHLIILGKVAQISASEDNDPLVFSAGEYRGLQ